MTPWKYVDATEAVVARQYDDGSSESCRADRADVLAWVAEGNTIEEPDPPPPPTPDEVEESANFADADVIQIATMTGAEANAFIDQVFPTLTAMQRRVLKAIIKSLRFLLRYVFKGRLP